MFGGIKDVVQRLAGGHQNLLRHTAANGTGATEIPRFDDQYGFAGSLGDTRRCESGIARAEHDHVITICHYQISYYPDDRRPGDGAIYYLLVI